MSSGLPVDFGWWALKDGRKALLSYWPDGGRLTLDGPNGCQVVAVVPTEEETRRLLNGWEDHCGQPDALGWLATALDGAR